MPTIQQLTDHYSKIYSKEHDQSAIQDAAADYYRNHYKELANAVGKLAPRIADIGCSIPVFLRCAREEGSDVIGVDYDEIAFTCAREWGVAMTRPDQFASAVADGAVDVLRYSHALEHMIDPVAALTAHVRKLAADGIVYITQPNFPVLAFRQSTLDIEDALWPEHLHFFNPISVSRLCDRAGLKVTRLFSSTDQEARSAKYAKAIDRPYSEEQTRGLAAVGDPFFGALNNWPEYFGANITVVARRA